MTKVNVHFAIPEPEFEVELDAQSQAAYDKWLDNPVEDSDSELWDAFIAEFERQVRPKIGSKGYIDEVYAVE